MKLLIATRGDEKINALTKHTIPRIQKYAEDCGADFKILSGEPPIWTNESPPRPHYRIMRFYDFLEDYDRILSVDSDLLINNDCPNIFEIVPYDCVGTIYEDVGPHSHHRKGQIALIQDQFGDIGWRGGYMNTGFALFSKLHREIFTLINGQYFMDFGYDDVHLCYNINKMSFKVHELDFHWNHMTMFSEPWNGCANRFDSHIIHYAGEGVFDRRWSNRIQQVKADLDHIERVSRGKENG